MLSKFNFTKNLKKYLIASAALLLVGLVLLFVLGVKPGESFNGFYRSTYSYTGEIDRAAVEIAVEEVLDLDVTVTNGSSADGKTTFINFETKESVSTEQQTAVTNSLTEKFKDNSIKFTSVKKVASGISTKAVVTVVVAAVIVIVFAVAFVALRFKAIGGLAVAAVALIVFIHDALLALFAGVVVGTEFETYFAAIVLLLLGNAIYNTVLVFDRVRDNKSKLSANTPDCEIADTSVRETFVRNAVAAGVTFAVAVALAVVCAVKGTNGFAGFVIPVAVGLVSSFYTSTFLAAPLWASFSKCCAAKKPAKKYSKKKR